MEEIKYRAPALPTDAEIREVAERIEAARKVAASGVYWPGQDYPDREEWLAKRNNPVANHRASLFYDPDKLVAGNQFKGVRQGRFNPGVNNLKRAAKKDPAVRKQLLELRRKAQHQGHVTVDKQMGAKS